MNGELFNRTVQPSFHNTVKLQGEELHKRDLKASSQDGMVLNYFMVTPPYKFTASQIIHAMRNDIKSQSSVRRALSNLSNPKKGQFLELSDEMKVSPDGAPEHYYKLINCKP